MTIKQERFNHPMVKVKVCMITFLTFSSYDAVFFMVKVKVCMITSYILWAMTFQPPYGES